MINVRLRRGKRPPPEQATSEFVRWLIELTSYDKRRTAQRKKVSFSPVSARINAAPPTIWKPGTSRLRDRSLAPGVNILGLTSDCLEERFLSFPSGCSYKIASIILEPGTGCLQVSWRLIELTSCDKRRAVHIQHAVKWNVSTID